jgi:ATP/maltotriose-dependent transcriptional regulator MalT
MNLRMSNGHIVEFRLHLKEIDEVAEGVGHDLYEQVRTIEAIIETEQGGVATAEQLTQIQQLNQQLEQLYNDAYQVILSRQ